MTNKNYLGEFEILVLAAVARAGDDAYGVRLCEEIRARTGRDISYGAMYTTLYRLEKKGLVSSKTGQASPVRGGRAKRFFVMRAAGRRALERSVASLASMTNGIVPGIKFV